MSDLDTNTDRFNHESLIADFEESDMDNEMLIKAIRKKESDVALAYLNRPDFKVDWNKHVDDKNIVCFVIENDLEGVFDALLKQPDYIVKELFSYDNNGITPIITAIMSQTPVKYVKKLNAALGKQPAKGVFIQKLVDDFPELIDEFTWDASTVNLYTIGWSDDYRINIVSYCIRNQKWDISKKLINLDSYSPLHHGTNSAPYATYKIARKMAKHHDEAKEIVATIFQKIEEKNPRIAKKLKGGLFGTGLGGHKYKI